jgi:tetratricopeptide (TPR) repeat protein
VIQEAEAIGKRMNDPEFIAELACLRTQDFAIARDLAAARPQLATGLATMRRMSDVPPSVTAECASAVAFVAQADGDFAKAIVYMRDAVESIDKAGMHDVPRYTSASNDLALAFLGAGRFHDAWEVEDRNLALMRDSGRTDTSAYLAVVSVGCVALRNGGQPRRALELVESVLADARRDVPNFVSPFYLDACRARNLIAMGRPEGGATLAQIADGAAKAGNLSGIVTLRAASAALAIEHGDLASADTAWALLASEEERALTTGDRGADVVLLVLLHARLDLAHAHVAEALRRLDMAATLVASRHQPSNPDAREVELVLAQAFMANHDYSQAAEHAGKGVELARAAAVDGHSSAWIGEALFWRARSEAALGKATVAAASAREALQHLEPNMDPTHPLIASAKSLLSR